MALPTNRPNVEPRGVRLASLDTVHAASAPAVGPPKGGKAAWIRLTAPAREALLDLVTSAGDGYLILNGKGKPRRHSEVERAFGKARDLAALPVTEDDPVVFHSLRHTGISRLANRREIPLVHVRDFARHANLATTESYVHKIDSPEVTSAYDAALSAS